MDNENKLENLSRLAKEMEDWKNDMLSFNYKEQVIHFTGFINGLVWAYRFNDLDSNNINPKLFDKIFIENESKDSVQAELMKILNKKESFKNLISWLATGNIL